jgi:hypothetical protein
VTVDAMGGGLGAITSTPAGITCGADCSEAFPEGATISLRATATTGSMFAGWSGGGCSGTGDCTVTVTADLAITAMFVASDSLVVTVTGNGTGSVTSSPAGIVCPGDCGENYALGQTVTLYASPGIGSRFAGWSGGGCSGTGSCFVSTNSPAAVTATFTLNQYTLTVARAGTGTGTVTSTPAGISCGATCSQLVNSGTSVLLNAAPAAGSTFIGWSGGGCSGTGSCSVTVTASTTVTASFGGSGGGSLSCSTLTNVISCSNGSIPEINLGPITSTACHDSCQTALPQSGVTVGCWVLASNGNCYCRSGVIATTTSGGQPGGTCN